MSRRLLLAAAAGRRDPRRGRRRRRAAEAPDHDHGLDEARPGRAPTTGSTSRSSARRARRPCSCSCPGTNGGRGDFTLTARELGQGRPGPGGVGGRPPLAGARGHERVRDGAGRAGVAAGDVRLLRWAGSPTRRSARTTSRRTRRSSASRPTGACEVQLEDVRRVVRPAARGRAPGAPRRPLARRVGRGRLRRRGTSPAAPATRTSTAWSSSTAGCAGTLRQRRPRARPGRGWPRIRKQPFLDLLGARPAVGHRGPRRGRRGAGAARTRPARRSARPSRCCPPQFKPPVPATNRGLARLRVRRRRRRRRRCALIHVAWPAQPGGPTATGSTAR